jgi:hypothetical protein
MGTDSDSINEILSLAPPNIHTVGDLEWTDKKLDLIYPPAPHAVECSTLQGLVDLWAGELDDASSKGDLLCHITSPTTVALLSRESDDHGRRRIWAEATYPECKGFTFGAWLDPEPFIIGAQANFQRVKVENDDGSFVKDLDYILQVASKISAEHAADNVDDGFAQRVTVRQGVALKTEQVLKPLVSLAPYRTFAEIDQVLSTFVFRARVADGAAKLALFEADGGRWKLGAYSALKTWLTAKFGDKVPVIS